MQRSFIVDALDLGARTHQVGAARGTSSLRTPRFEKEDTCQECRRDETLHASTSLGVPQPMASD
jgi:hypothetical protein